MQDHRGQELRSGDRVVPICWGGSIPLWLCNTQATVQRLGRSRVYVQFDGVRYNEGDKPHRAPASWFRRI